jgi:hypothetical protein
MPFAHDVMGKALNNIAGDSYGKAIGGSADSCLSRRINDDCVLRRSNPLAGARISTVIDLGAENDSDFGSEDRSNLLYLRA